jgi:rubrerythrin
MAKSLKDTKTHGNLKEAFAGESQANRRYLYFARRADIEGYPDVGGLFRDTSEAETGHAFGHLDFLKEVGDPATGEPIGATDQNLKAAIVGETYEFTEMYPGFAKTARDEGFEEIAECSRRWRRPRNPMPVVSPRVSSRSVAERRGSAVTGQGPRRHPRD